MNTQSFPTSEPNPAERSVPSTLNKLLQTADAIDDAATGSAAMLRDAGRHLQQTQDTEDSTTQDETP